MVYGVGIQRGRGGARLRRRRWRRSRRNRGAGARDSGGRARLHARGKVRVALAALGDAALGGDLLVAGEASIARERRDAAAEEAPARDLVVGRLDERAVQQQLVLGDVPR